mgnify:FL=1
MHTIYAAIDMGSNALKLKIVQYINKRRHVLDQVSRSVRIGEDIFSKGNIEHDTVKDIIRIMELFQAMMESYAVEQYRAVATGAFRLADNNLNVLEMILMRTGIQFEIVEDTVEKFLTYKSIRDNLDNYREIRKSAILVELNSGSCDVSIYSQNKLVFNEEFTIGTLVMKNIMRELESRSIHYLEPMQALVETRTAHMWKAIQNRKIQHFLAIGGAIKIMKQHLIGELEMLERDAVEKMYKRLMKDHLLYRKEIEETGMDWYEFVVGVLVYRTFLGLVNTDHMLLPQINVRDGLIATMIEQDYQLKRYRLFNGDILSLARSISSRYRSNIKHCQTLEQNGAAILEALNTVFPFDERDELLLRVAAILHEIGKFARTKDYLSTSFYKIRNLSVLGMTEHEMMMVAYICKFMTDRESSRMDMMRLNQSEQNRILKLSSILSISDALDKGKRQRIEVLDFKVTRDEFILYYRQSEDTTLEQWNFDNRKTDFINTFGLIPKMIEVES